MIIPWDKDIETKNTGIVYSGMLDLVRDLLDEDEALAGEFAICCMCYVLTNENPSDDKQMKRYLSTYTKLVSKAQSNYADKLRASREQRIDNLKLEEIADCLKQGMKQKDIAAKLDIKPSTLSSRIKVLYTDFKELLLTHDEYKEKLLLENGIDMEEPANCIGVPEVLSDDIEERKKQLGF